MELVVRLPRPPSFVPLPRGELYRVTEVLMNVMKSPPPPPRRSRSRPLARNDLLPNTLLPTNAHRKENRPVLYSRASLRRRRGAGLSGIPENGRREGPRRLSMDVPRLRCHHRRQRNHPPLVATRPTHPAWRTGSPSREIQLQIQMHLDPRVCARASRPRCRGSLH